MRIRDYQVNFINDCITALKEHGNTLGVSPTGSGKTVMLAYVVQLLQEQKKDIKVCVIAHRKELIEQNAREFLKVNPSMNISFVNAENKDWSNQIIFAMVQTLANKRTLDSMPRLDLLVIDETHHATASSYEKIITKAIELNPNVMIFGVTATPNRGDKSNLCKVFNNCGHQIYLLDLIQEGFLVRPKTFVIDVAQERLKALKPKMGDYSESEVSDILNSVIISEEVVRVWREKASDRKTVIFCSTIEHAESVTAIFKKSGISTTFVTSEMSKAQRESSLEDVVIGKTQVIVNVAILTEGWNFPPISCVVLLRQSSHKSAMIQMIGRGLRSIDPTIYPCIEKKDCIVLDFGISSLLHKSLEDEANLNPPPDRDKKSVSSSKICPDCEGVVGITAKECPLCSYEFDLIKDKQLLGNFSMKEIDMLHVSSLAWYKPNDKMRFCSGFYVWSSIVCQNKQYLVVVGYQNKEDPEVIYEGAKFTQAIKKAESFLRKNDIKRAINKEIAWHDEEATSKQIKSLRQEYRKDGLLKGEAAALLTFQFNAERQLKHLGLIA